MKVVKTLLDLERIATGRWRLRLKRADACGNVTAMAPIEGTLTQIHSIAADSLQRWAGADEHAARQGKKGPPRHR